MPAATPTNRRPRRLKSRNKKAFPKDGLLEFLSLHVLAFIVDLVGLCLPLSFSPGSCTRAEGFLVTLPINKDGP
jgi:hypothetical protein